MSKRSFVVVFASLLVGLASLLVSAQSAPDKNAFPSIKIANFGQLDDRFYRGARPKERDFAALKALGIETIIDLTDNTPEERGYAEAAGLKYINIVIKDKSYPTPEAVEQFLRVSADPATGKFFVHCAGGRHRTGDMGALYRFVNYGWNFDQVMQEMKNFDYYASGHKKSYDFVVDYAAKYDAERLAKFADNAEAGTK